ncbi:MAG: calcium-binding protein [Sulfitobacter sp.]
MPIDPDQTLNGTAGDDVIAGGDGADVIFGFEGDDSLLGEEGDDSIVGGDGSDTLRGGYGDDTLIGGDGDDEIEGLYGNDVIDTGAGNDHVFGRDGDDLIYGREGDDHLIGSIGTDTVYGGDGNDTMAGSQGNDEIHGGDGNDLAFIGVFEDSDRIFMDAGNDFVDGASAGSSFYAEGGTGNDTLNSGVGNDTLDGGAGNDLLNGGAGDDLLIGGGDVDIVTGGDGDDMFVVLDVPGALHIMDFGANGAADMIDLSQLSGYDTAQAVSDVMVVDQGVTSLTLAVTGGTLVVTIHSEAPVLAQDLGLDGVLEGTVNDSGDPEGGDPDAGGGDDTLEGGSGDDNLARDLFAIEGPDAGHFVVDPQSGEISNMDWFTPNYDEVWDVNGDHVYEVSLVGFDASGAQISRSDMELVVTPTGTAWRLAGEETPDEEEGDLPEDNAEPDAGTGGPVFSLTGADAEIFEVDPETGDVSFKDWFTPNYDEVWDMDRDHIYEVSVVETGEGGAELSRADLELVVSQTDAVWREAEPRSEEEDSAPEETGGPAGFVDGSAGTEGLQYALSGQDAEIFDIEADTGGVSFKSWFTPSFDDVWDMDRDHIYEISVLGTDESGAEVSRADLELVVSQEDAVWREAVPEEEPTGEEMMAMLFTPMAPEDEMAVEEEVEDDAGDALGF